MFCSRQVWNHVTESSLHISIELHTASWRRLCQRVGCHSNPGRIFAVGRKPTFDPWLGLNHFKLATPSAFVLHMFHEPNPTPPRSNRNSPATAPQEIRDGLAELMQLGLRVARMVATVADAETELAQAAARAGVEAGVPAMATSLAEAIEADRASAAAAEARQIVAARVEAVAGAFARVSRGIRLTVMLMERFDRGWARRGEADDRHAMARRQIARGVADAIGREAEGERGVSLNAALAERLEALDTEGGIGDRSVQAVIDEICRELGLDPARMVVRSPVLGAVRVAEVERVVPPGGAGWAAGPGMRRPDG
jgi:hypothetical protein